MNKSISKVFILLLSFVLTSCLPSINKTTTTNNPTSSDNPSTSTDSSTSEDNSTDTDTMDPDEEDTSKIDSISLSVREIEVEVGKRSATPIVNYVFNIPEEEVTLELKTVTWKISDTDIASVDEYGRVTGKASGKTTLTCTSVEGKKKAYATVFVYPSGGSITKRWIKLSSNVALYPGDQLLFACPERNRLATTDATGMFLHSTSATFEGLEVSNIGSAAQFILGEDYKGRGGYTLEVPEREDGTYLAATNTGKVSFYDTAKSSATLWDIEYDTSQSCWDIRSHTNVDGWFMYNASQDKFTTYQSNVQVDMFTVTLYRLTRV